MKTFLPLILVWLLLLSCQEKRQQEDVSDQASPIEKAFTYETTGSVERLAPEFDLLIPEDATIEILSSGFDWTEGPLWVPEGEYLLFCDIPPNTVYKWKEGDSTSVYLNPSGYTGTTERAGEVGSNGLALNAAGQLVLCQHGDRRMAYMDALLSTPKSEFVTIADKYDNQRFNSPNDAAYHSNGDLYFTDPPYGLEQQMTDPTKEIGFQGVYRVDPEGVVTLLIDSLTRPNGIAFSPDERTLYVANSDPEKAIWATYDVIEDGTLANGRIFFDATAWVADQKGLPDGLKVDHRGYVIATGPGGVHFFDPEGKHLGAVRTGQATSNCAIGNNGTYLYMTADMHLMRIPLLTD